MADSRLSRSDDCISVLSQYNAYAKASIGNMWIFQLLNTDISERKKQCLGAYPQKVVLRRKTKDSKSCFDLVSRSTVEDSLQRKPQRDRAVSKNFS